LAQAGKRDDARQILVKITESDPDFPEIKEAKALLQKISN